MEVSSVGTVMVTPNMEYHLHDQRNHIHKLFLLTGIARVCTHDYLSNTINRWCKSIRCLCDLDQGSNWWFRVKHLLLEKNKDTSVDTH